MIKYLEKSGRTREEALAAALAELGMSEEEILGSRPRAEEGKGREKGRSRSRAEGREEARPHG